MLRYTINNEMHIDEGRIIGNKALLDARRGSISVREDTVGVTSSVVAKDVESYILVGAFPKGHLSGMS